MHQVEIDKIEYHPSSKGYILLLKKISSNIRIPILIGSNEAQALSLAYEDINLPRPTTCLLYTSPSPRDLSTSRMPSSA